MRAPSESARRPRRRAGLAVMALAAAALAGCGTSVQEGSRLTVYVGGAAGGPSAVAVADGAELALEQAGGEVAGVPVALEPLPAAPQGAAAESWVQAEIAAGARTAAEDSTAIAYLGETASEETAISVPITNEAGILQVATGPVAEELLREPGGNDVPGEFQTTGERTLVAPAAEGGGEPIAIDPGFAADFEAAYGRRPDRAAAFGHAAMALVLDSIETGEDPLDRLDVIEAALGAGERESALGPYAIDSAGVGTLGG